MEIYENLLYIDDLKYIIHYKLPWNLLNHSTFLISGASGLIGSCLVDTIMTLNSEKGFNCKVYALGRNLERAKKRFAYCWNDEDFHFISHDINKPLGDKINEDVDYVFHLASNTHPVSYATDPIGTITTNILGTYNMLEFALQHKTKRVEFASSNEIYGENRGDVEFFDENYCGYINSNTLRAGYPESKRCGEALCQAFRSKNNLDVVIPRLTRSFGPTMLETDTKAISQFIHKGVAGEDIVLKSDGKQYYSYTYVIDTVVALLTILLKGRNGEAYNIADESGDIMLKDLANIIAEYTGGKVVYEMPDAIEKAGYSTATKARLDGNKLKSLGWNPKYSLESGVKRTISILREL